MRGAHLYRPAGQGVQAQVWPAGLGFGLSIVGYSFRISPVDDEVIFKPLNENRRSEENVDFNPSPNNFDYENETFDDDPEETKGSSFNDEEEEVS